MIRWAEAKRVIFIWHNKNKEKSKRRPVALQRDRATLRPSKPTLGPFPFPSARTRGSRNCSSLSFYSDNCEREIDAASGEGDAASRFFAGGVRECPTSGRGRHHGRDLHLPVRFLPVHGREVGGHAQMPIASATNRGQGDGKPAAQGRPPIDGSRTKHPADKPRGGRRGIHVTANDGW